MDSYSGRFPLDSISFRLDMTSEQRTENSELPTADPNVPAQSLPEQRADPSHVARPTETNTLLDFVPCLIYLQAVAILRRAFPPSRGKDLT